MESVSSIPAALVDFPGPWVEAEECEEESRREWFRARAAATVQCMNSRVETTSGLTCVCGGGTNHRFQACLFASDTLPSDRLWLQRRGGKIVIRWFVRGIEHSIGAGGDSKTSNSFTCSDVVEMRGNDQVFSQFCQF